MKLFEGEGMEQVGGNITVCLGCTCEGQNLGKWAGHGPFPVESQPSGRQKFKTCRGSCELPTFAANDSHTTCTQNNPAQNRDAAHQPQKRADAFSRHGRSGHLCSSGRTSLTFLTTKVLTKYEC